MNKGNFLNALEKAKRGEELVKNYFIEKGWDVEDLSNDEEWQEQDVDFAVCKEDEFTSYLVEVKLDSVINETGNFFIETMTDIYRNMEGWFEKTSADLVFYIDAETDTAYVFSVEDMREYIENNFVPRRHAKEWLAGHMSVSLGYCVSVKDYARHYKLKKIEL